MGGAEHVVTSLADELANKGNKIIIAYMTGHALVKPDNKTIQVLNLGLSSKAKLPLAYLKLRKLIRTFQPDIVHSHMFHANILSRLVRLTVPIPKLINSAHNTNEGGNTRMLAYRLTDKLCEITTNVSEEAVEAFIQKGATKKGRIIPLHNSISTSKFKFSLEDRKRLRTELEIGDHVPLLLAVGRLHEQKDYPNLLVAFSELLKTKPYAQLIIVGDGHLKNKLVQLAKSLDLNKSIRFLGIRNDIPSLMSAADIFVLSSAWEGFGLVVAEAMSCNRIVVATDCGGVREVVGNAGFLVQPKNSKELSKSLLKAIELTNTKKTELSNKARKRILNKFSSDSTIQKWLKIYDLPKSKLRDPSFITTLFDS